MSGDHFRFRMPRFSRFILVLLAIELMDELVFGAGEAAWPLIRDDLGLTYLEIGVLLSLPRFVGSFVEPVMGVLSDYHRPHSHNSARRWLVLGGGVIFSLSLFLTAASWGFIPLLVSFVLFYPASGAFVSLSQAALMDAEPERREINMARWTFAGSLGVVLGPLALGLVVQMGGGWRQVFALFGIFALALWFFARRLNFSRLESGDAPPESLSDFFSMLRATLGALRSGTVLRWLALLEFSDLMLDVLLGFLALYMVDVAGVGLAQAGVAVAVWTGAGLLGDFLLIPLLEKMSGLAYLRLSACLEFGLYIAFLLTPYGWAKLAVLALLGFFNSGWYAILQAQLYKALPGRSGAAMAANSIAGLVGGLIPLGLGWVAQRYNLQMSMWLLLSGPIALILGLWRVKYFQQGEINTEDLDD